MTFRPIRIAVVIACVFASAAGCGSPSKRATDLETTPASSAANTDPCAMRLHDVCGPLLLYYATNRALPAKLEQLTEVRGFANVKDFTCPVSGKPYVYNPAGIPAPDRAMRLIIYDAVPAHGNVRWAISIPAAPGEGPLVAKVLAVPESRFSK